MHDGVFQWYSFLEIVDTEAAFHTNEASRQQHIIWLKAWPRGKAFCGGCN